MKTIVKDGKYVRINDVEAEQRVKAGWKYCPKSEWKSNVRDLGKPSKEEVEAEKQEKKTKREKKS